MLIYIHVPFCLKKCDYCSFFSEPLGQLDFQESEKRKQLWLETLLIELDTKAKQLGKVEIETIFFGGGTPSLIEPEYIRIILAKIKKYFNLNAKTEITLEANPDSLNSFDKARAYIFAGINRLSIGVQSLNDSMLKDLGRIHTASEVYSAIQFARSAGCKNINVDMMWGLPKQRLSHWLNQLSEVINCEVEHISAYSLTLEKETPFANIYAHDKKSELPDESELAAMYLKGSALMQEAGYIQYEVSNYSKIGYECRHNIGYWEGKNYIGLGPSATSTIKNIRQTNPSSLKDWCASVQQQAQTGKINTALINQENLTNEDRIIELVMLRLRTVKGLHFKAFAKLTGRDFFKDNETLITALRKNGLLRILNGYLSLTRQGFLVSNAILSHLLENTRQHLNNNHSNS